MLSSTPTSTFDSRTKMTDENPHVADAVPETPSRPRRPGYVPTCDKGNGLTVRAYRPDDDAYLMELERLCPRGEPRPFVHFRRQFIDRAMLYHSPYLFIAEKDGRPIGVTSIAIKDTQIGEENVRVSYSFDTRVHPHYRRQGIANAMQEEKVAFLKSEGVSGIYAFVVSTNYASIKMLEKVGFQKVRLVLFLSFTPYPMIIPPFEDPISTKEANAIKSICNTFGRCDLYNPMVASAVTDYNFERFTLGNAGLSVFDQSLVYQQISADEPWPTLEEISRRARTMRLFDETGLKHADDLKGIFDHIRDLAVVSNVSKLTWIIDRSSPVPHFIFEEASSQKDYWMLFRPLRPNWTPNWTNNPIYIDARDL